MSELPRDSLSEKIKMNAPHHCRKLYEFHRRFKQRKPHSKVQALVLWHYLDDSPSKRFCSVVDIITPREVEQGERSDAHVREALAKALGVTTDENE